MIATMLTSSSENFMRLPEKLIKPKKCFGHTDGSQIWPQLISMVLPSFIGRKFAKELMDASFIFKNQSGEYPEHLDKKGKSSKTLLLTW